jgi:hypothetical protein
MYNVLKPIRRNVLPTIPVGRLLQKSYNITKTDLKIAKFLRKTDKSKWKYTELIHISPDVKQRVKKYSTTPSPKRRRESPYEIVANF